MAYETGKTTMGETAQDVIVWRIKLAMFYVGRPDDAKAEPLLARSLEEYLAATCRRSSRDRAAVLGLTRLHLKQWDAAESALRECWEMRKQQLPDTWQLASSQSMLGERSGAEEIHRRRTAP